MAVPDVAHGAAPVDPVTQQTLARHRVRFLTSSSLPMDAAVRRPILASWRRSVEMHVAADEVNPILTVDPELDTPLTRAAAPVLQRLFSVLDGQPVSIVLTDRHGLVLSRLTADHALERRLDGVGLAPGFNYAERSVGTNGIGTALEVGAPTHVFGHEHFAERLEDLACAGVPIRNPVTGRTVGLVDLTCWQKNAGSLLMVLASTTALAVQESLTSQAGAHERELLDEYLRACRRTPGIVLAVSSTVGMLNDYARKALSAVEQSHLLTHAREALAAGRRESVDVDLPGGVEFRMLIHPVGEPGPTAGLVVRVVRREGSVPGQRSAADRPARPLPGLVGTGPLWLHACAQVEQHYLAQEWLAVLGEEGVGRLSVLRAVQLRRQPVPRLVVLDGEQSGPDEWVRPLREAVRLRTSNLVLQHVDRLTSPQLRSTCELLRELRDAPGPTPWAAVTLGDPHDRPDLQELMRLFPGTTYVPPLRLHAGDIPALTRHFTRRSSDGSVLDWSGDAMQVLIRATWPGNVGQLHQVVRWVMARRRSGVVEPAHLPAEVRSISRRSLNVLESLERDAIADALADAHGDRGVAAAALGMSRATIYRRIRTFGIVDPPG
ncbi:MAG: GAF domain-containing protein [Nocardioidaceae bacterium]